MVTRTFSVYARVGMQEFCFSGKEYGKQSLKLRASVLGIRKDLRLFVICREEGWFLERGKDWRAFQEEQESQEVGTDPGRILLECGKLRSIGTGYGERLFLLLQETPVCSSFALPGLNLQPYAEITLGKSRENDIVFDFQEMISGTHMGLKREAGSWTLAAEGSNGVYLNCRQITEKEILSYGDVIRIPGLSMVYLGEYLAFRPGKNAGVDLPGRTEGCSASFHGAEEGTGPAEQTADRSASCHGAEDGTGQLYRENASDRNSRKNIVHPDGMRKTRRQSRPGKRETDTRRILMPVPMHKRIRPEEEEIVIMDPPPRETAHLQPVFLEAGGTLGLLLPMIMASVLSAAFASSSSAPGGYLISGLSFSFSYAAVNLIWMMAQRRYQKREGEKREEQRNVCYRAYLEEILKRVRESYACTSRQLQQYFPSAAECLLFSETDTRLWNSVRSAEDPVLVRLGTGLLPGPVPIRFPAAELTVEPDPLRDLSGKMLFPYLQMEGMPVCLDFEKHPAILLNGEEGMQNTARAALQLVLCAVSSYCYTEVRLAVCTDPDLDDDLWKMLRWLPHVWSPGNRSRYMTENETQTRDLCKELDERLNVKEGVHYIFVISRPDWVKGEALMKRLAVDKGGESVPMTALFLRREGEWTPSFCTCQLGCREDICILKEEEPGQDAPLRSIRLDSFPMRDVDRFARNLADLRTARKEGIERIPDMVSFFELYEIDRPEDLMVHQRWQSAHTFEGICARIGKMAGRRNLILDLHEKGHGPHGLAAGTTGSGKSELLQSFLLSLAVEYSPQDIVFFLIDYKGGGMSGAFHGIPHLAGEISNLSGSSIGRALAALKSENRRRQKLLAQAGVNHIDMYNRVRTHEESASCMPHLLIVVDEFAELKKENPEFLEELISVSQVGRSLGVHLILSTQKPQGIVDERIRSNTRFRLCLRVQEVSESMDMVHRPDAALFRQAGRCCLEIGNEERFETFQSAYSGMRYDPDGSGQEKNRSALISLEGKRKNLRSESLGKETGAMTQLEAVCRYLTAAAETHGFHSAERLWMPELEKNLYLEEIQAKNPVPAGVSRELWDGSVRVPVGILDNPYEQKQIPFYLEFPQMGHLAVIGTSGSGKSTFLQTAVLSMTCAYAPDRVHVFLVDYGGGQLTALKYLPHVGGICLPGEPAWPLFALLRQTIQKRKQTTGGGDFNELLSAGKAEMPIFFLIIDEYGSFREQTDGEFNEEVLWIVREGPRCGVHLILSAGSAGGGQIPLLLMDQLLTAVALGLADRVAYMEVLRLREIPILPDRRIKGRALAVCGAAALELQTALPVRADAYQRREYLMELGKQMARRWKGKPPVKIPSIPSAPGAKAFFALEETLELLEAGDVLPLGYDLRTARIAGVLLEQVFCFMISGGGRSGKKNLMNLMIHSAWNMHAKVIRIDFRGILHSMIPKKTEKCFCTDICSTDQLISWCEEELTPIYKARNRLVRSFEEEGMTRDEIYGHMKDQQCIFICFADLEEVILAAREDERGLGDFLLGLFQRGELHRVYFAAILGIQGQQRLAGDPLYTAFASWNTGIHLGGGTVSVPDLSFDYLSYAEQTKKEKPGIGQLSEPLTHEGTKKIRIPMAWR